MARPPDGPSLSWQAPFLHPGTNDISGPRLLSGDARVTVACAPSAACSLAGATLTITDPHVQVTVTWSSGASDRFAPWQAQRVYASS